jgi:hypothetical protein
MYMIWIYVLDMGGYVFWYVYAFPLREGTSNHAWISIRKEIEISACVPSIRVRGCV